MRASLIKILIKIIAYRFYKAHAGLLLFLFVSVAIYFFFIQVLNQTHLPDSQIIYHNLILVLSLLSSPVMALLMCIAWLFYTVKSWSFAASQLALEENRFLFYSVTSFSRSNQFMSWLIVQFIISLPIIAYTLFMWIIGICFGYYLVPLLLVLYIIILIIISSGFYLNCMNCLMSNTGKTDLMALIRRWPKPFFSLFLYYVFHKQKKPLVVTKVFSALILVSPVLLLNNSYHELRTGALIILGVVTAHTSLFWLWHCFENRCLTFSLNFPWKHSSIYAGYAVTYLILTLPENILLLVYCHGDLLKFITLTLLSIGIAMLLRTVLYTIEPDVTRFVHIVFYLFVIFFITLLYGLLWELILLSFTGSFLIVYNRRHKQHLFTSQRQL